jgi:hypothetical protein
MNRRHFLASLGGTIAASAAAGTASASQFEELRRLRLERDGEARPRRDDSEPRRTRHEPARQRGESGFAAPAGADLQAVLAAWSRQAGWTLVWQSAYAYELTSGGRFAGTFEDSVRALLLAMRHTRPNPTAVFYGGNRVLVISNQSQTATD